MLDISIVNETSPEANWNRRTDRQAGRQTDKPMCREAAPPKRHHVSITVKFLKLIYYSWAEIFQNYFFCSLFNCVLLLLSAAQDYIGPRSAGCYSALFLVFLVCIFYTILSHMTQWYTTNHKIGDHCHTCCCCCSYCCYLVLQSLLIPLDIGRQ